jgi:uncharacterized protein
MKHTFRSLGNRQEVDLIPYLREKLAERDDISLYMGSDSQNVGRYTIYACVIVLHYGNSGAHVLYTREKIKKIRDIFAKIWKEVELSLEVARYLESQGIQKVEYIDIDINPDPIYRSNTVLRVALGMIESYGYKVRFKPDSITASCCADRICK